MWSLMSDATHVYATGVGSITRINKATRTVEPFASGSTNETWNDATHVYWVSGPHQISRQAKAGGTVQHLVNGVTGRIIDITVDATYLYWTEDDTNLVRRRPKVGGGTIQTLNSQTAGPEFITVDDTHVYWTSWDLDGPTGHLYRTAKSGGTAQLLVPDNLSFNNTIVVDGQHVYAIADGRLVRVPKGGGTKTVLSNSDQVSDFDVDATHIVWADAGTVRMREKATGNTGIVTVVNWDYSEVLLEHDRIWWTEDDGKRLIAAPRCACEP
jgi:hypothetical protein